MSVISMLRNRIEKRIAYLLFRTVYKKKENLVIFESYNGEDNGYSCNPKALYEEMIKDNKYSRYYCIWSFQHPEKFSFLKEMPRTDVVEKGSYKYLRSCAKARYLFTNTSFPSYIWPDKKQKMIYLWHGKPLKCIGCGIKGAGDGKRSRKKIEMDYRNSGKRLSVLLSPAPVFSDIMCQAYRIGKKKRKESLLEMGYPRNDFLFRYTREEAWAIKEKLGIPQEKKVILYAPTWRPYHFLGKNHFQHTGVMNYGRLQKELGAECVVLCRLHHLESGTVQYDQYPGFLYEVTDYPDVNDLYIISDLMISDYSGTIFDYANLKRPIVLYMYDKERYINQANGLNFPLDILPGEVVETETELIEAVSSQLEKFEYNEKYKKFNEIFNLLEGSNSAKNILEAVME